MISQGCGALQASFIANQVTSRPLKDPRDWHLDLSYYQYQARCSLDSNLMIVVTPWQLLFTGKRGSSPAFSLRSPHFLIVASHWRSVDNPLYLLHLDFGLLVVRLWLERVDNPLACSPDKGPASSLRPVRQEETTCAFILETSPC
jgi:hypothetical protein